MACTFFYWGWKFKFLYSFCPKKDEINIWVWWLYFWNCRVIRFICTIFSDKGSSKWIKVHERRTLHNVLKEPNYIIPGIPGVMLPQSISNIITTTLCILINENDFIFSIFVFLDAVFYLVSRNSKFYKDFKAGRWVPPS